MLIPATNPKDTRRLDQLVWVHQRANASKSTFCSSTTVIGLSVVSELDNIHDPDMLGHQSHPSPALLALLVQIQHHHPV
ncbi:hypothetical protein PCANC_10545 [Puccinia coronata f. sp. avenae]|uniref:Uncharacterized protein n=1 Tax=Puccinia coronata f. sp. avenae TaxID=200324 RepID=A0A2N5VZ59_9BASI|nr:hypothetical protein PCANC_10545 [Puccinia coronata f. sp. avenae]